MHSFLVVCSLLALLATPSIETVRRTAMSHADSVRPPAAHDSLPAQDLVHRIGSDPCALASFAQLLRGSFGDVEVAAFVVDDERSLSCRIWPRLSWYRSQTFKGEMPAETLAIVHTHPGTEEEPSPNDRQESARLRMPFFVITRFAIWVTDGGADARKLRGNDWLVGVPRRLPEDCSRTRMAR